MVVSSALSSSHLIYPATLPNTHDQLSVLSYNVLLPNSLDGWWNYKMYQPSSSLSDEVISNISSWDYRSDLIRNKIQTLDPDVVCMQEVSPLSFTQDFEFMKQLGYDGVEMFRRGRFRPATFWKTEKCHLVHDAVHKDRTLLTCFELNNLDESHACFGRYWHVLNCHLQAGPEGKRRVRQIDDGVKASFKLAKKLNEVDPTNPLLIVCGDFNGGSECGAVHYLEDGEVGPDFIEDGEPVSSKSKKSPLSQPMIDAAKSIIREVDHKNEQDIGPPSTLVVSELISQMVNEGTEAFQSPELSDVMIQKLTRSYENYASHEGKVMNKIDVEKWLIDINKQVGRGSEFRTAAREMGWKEPEIEGNTNEEVKNEKPRIYLPEEGILSLDGFLNVYRTELRGGKFWGINYDLAIMGQPLPSIGLFKARYDRMYCSTALVPTVFVDTISNNPCPNDIEPSDHLPVAGQFSLAPLN